MFDTNKTYVFQAKLLGDSLDNLDKYWGSQCNNRIVKVSSDGYLGTITINGVDYWIMKSWCRVLDDTKVDAFCKATGQQNPNS